MVITLRASGQSSLDSVPPFLCINSETFVVPIGIVGLRIIVFGAQHVRWRGRSLKGSRDPRVRSGEGAVLNPKIERGRRARSSDLRES